MPLGASALTTHKLLSIQQVQSEQVATMTVMTQLRKAREIKPAKMSRVLPCPSKSAFDWLMGCWKRIVLYFTFRVRPRGQAKMSMWQDGIKTFRKKVQKRNKIIIYKVILTLLHFNFWTAVSYPAFSKSKSKLSWYQKASKKLSKPLNRKRPLNPIIKQVKQARLKKE